jgi:hypothetical protein
LLKSYLTNGISVQASIIGEANPRIADWDGPKGFGNVDVLASFAVSVAGVYPLRLVAGHSSGAADLEWFSIQPDSTRILLNDTSTPNALLTFRARNPGALPHLNRPTISGGAVTISWTGVGLLEEASSLAGPWYTSADQGNPHSVAATGTMKFYRIRQF